MIGLRLFFLRLFKCLFETNSGAVLLGSILITLSVLISSGGVRVPTFKGIYLPFMGVKVTSKIGLGQYPVLGNKGASVTMTEFADLRCPFCEQFYKDAWPQIKKDYVDTGKIKFVFRDYAFLGPASVTAAEGANCANEQGQFWKFHDWMYNNQAGESNTDYYSKTNLITYATKLGLDKNKFADCLNSDKYLKQVDSDLAYGQSVGVNGTPTIFINDTPVVGAQPYSAFKTILDQALATSK